MTRPRSQIVSLADTPYYHCVSRCVRRAFLCGDDRYSGQNFDHRKPWLVERMALLAEVFAIDIAAYAVMSNHYHVVMHVDRARSQSWSRDEVIHRWLRLYKGDPLVHRYREGKLRREAEFGQLDRIVETWRERLADISWFMRCLRVIHASLILFAQYGHRAVFPCKTNAHIRQPIQPNTDHPATRLTTRMAVA